MGLMEGRLRGLSVGWSDVTVSEIYTVHDIRPLLSKNCLNVWRRRSAWAHMALLAAAN